MTKEQRIDFQYITAAVMLAVGSLLSVVGFYTEPIGDISNSVLWFFAQTLIYAGSVFGISTYVNVQLRDFEHRITHRHEP